MFHQPILERKELIKKNLSDLREKIDERLKAKKTVLEERQNYYLEVLIHLCDDLLTSIELAGRELLFFELFIKNYMVEGVLFILKKLKLMNTRFSNCYLEDNAINERLSTLIEKSRYLVDGYKPNDDGEVPMEVSLSYKYV